MKKIILVAVLAISGLAAVESPSQAAPARVVTNFSIGMPSHYRPTYVFRCHPSMVPRGCKDAFR